MFIIEIHPSGKIEVHPAANGDKPSISQIRSIVGEHIIGHPLNFHDCIMITADKDRGGDTPVCSLVNSLLPKSDDRIRGPVVIAKEEDQNIIGIEESDLGCILADLIAISERTMP